MTKLLERSDLDPRCPSRVALRVGPRRTVSVPCNYRPGHKADGSHAFAFHTGRHGTAVVSWTEGQVTVEVNKERREK